MQANAWTVFPLLISGIWFLKHHILLQFNPQHGATGCVIKTVLKHSNERTKNQSNTSEDPGWTSVDHVTKNAKLSRFDALLCIFEDNEAVIKMITEGRSPTNGIMFSALWTIQCFPVAISATLMTLKPCRRGRILERKQRGEDERVVAKSRPARNLVSMTLNIGLQQCRVRAHFKAVGISLQTVQLWIHLGLRDRKRLSLVKDFSLIFWPYRHTMPDIWTKSSHTYERNLVVQRKTFLSKTLWYQRNDLGKENEENWGVTKNTEFSEIRLLFCITQKLILDQDDEISGVSTIGFDQTP